MPCKNGFADLSRFRRAHGTEPNRFLPIRNQTESFLRLVNSGLCSKIWVLGSSTQTELKHVQTIALLRVIPTLRHFSAIVSDASSGRMYGIHILTFYPAFFLAYTMTFDLTCFPAYTDIPADIISGVLSGIYSDALFGIYSGSLSGIWHQFWHFVWYLLRHSISGIYSGILSDISIYIYMYMYIYLFVIYLFI